MSNIKLLNLDELNAETDVEIVLNQKKHKLAEMTVQNFIWVQKELKRMESAAADSTAHFDMLVNVLTKQFPTASVEEFQGLTLNKLRVLMDFVNDLAKDGAEVALDKAQVEGSENPPTAAQAA